MFGPVRVSLGHQIKHRLILAAGLRRYRASAILTAFAGRQTEAALRPKARKSPSDCMALMKQWVSRHGLRPWVAYRDEMIWMARSCLTSACPSWLRTRPRCARVAIVEISGGACDQWCAHRLRTESERQAGQGATVMRGAARSAPARASGCQRGPHLPQRTDPPPSWPAGFIHGLFGLGNSHVSERRVVLSPRQTKNA
jgi:hypothetical protein